MGDRQAIIAGIGRFLEDEGSVSVPRKPAPIVKKPKKKKRRIIGGQFIPKVNPADRQFAEDWVKGKD